MVALRRGLQTPPTLGPSREEGLPRLDLKHHPLFLPDETFQSGGVPETVGRLGTVCLQSISFSSFVWTLSLIFVGEGPHLLKADIGVRRWDSQKLSI